MDWLDHESIIDSKRGNDDDSVISQVSPSSVITMRQVPAASLITVCGVTAHPCSDHHRCRYPGEPTGQVKTRMKELDQEDDPVPNQRKKGDDDETKIKTRAV